MTIKEIQDKAKELHDPSLVDTESHVYQIWGDGELTSTKAGDLFGSRTLHQMGRPILSSSVATMAVERGKNSYSIVTKANAYEFRKMFFELSGSLDGLSVCDMDPESPVKELR